MLYLDYAKPLTGGKYILNFFAESIEDLDSISHGQRFITKNGIDYGVPQPSSTVVITMPDKTKKTYVLNEAGEWQEGGVDMDYSKLENAPIILANLADKEFIPEANTYYEHLGETTEDFIKGIIYLYDGKGYKAIDGSGSGAGVQPDYNQNDSAAADYIKNRPFYEETKTALAEVFNQTLTFEWYPTNNYGNSSNQFNDSNPMGGIRRGESVTVIFNGVEYNLTTQELPNEVKEEVEAYGGTGFIAGAPYDGVAVWQPTSDFPFTIIYYGADNINGTSVSEIIVNTSINQASIPVIVKANKTTTELHTIDPKYIKDMYYTKSDVGEKTLVFKGEINGITDKFSSLFEVGDTVSLKEDAVSLNVINYAKKYVSPDGSVQCVYVGNFYIIATAFELGGAEDTKEDYCCFYLISDSVDQLWYTNKNKKAPNNIEIYKGADPIVRIPEKYLPLDVAKKSYVDAAISDAITKTLNTEV